MRWIITTLFILSSSVSFLGCDWKDANYMQEEEANEGSPGGTAVPEEDETQSSENEADPPTNRDERLDDEAAEKSEK